MADWPYSTAAWQRLRQAKLAAVPLCEPCERLGRVTPAQHVDHVKAINAGGDPFPPLEGLMSMCPGCHSVKTNAVDRKGGSGIRFKGVGLDGLPIDPDHPFVAEGYTPSNP
ncbi:HNH endonuclease [Oryzibacter oryziterrae]|uniref:HNH endonuclease n=1 Tax=Oryzibacter oryziterrae TaxID=2766474 RepID=UPI001F1DF89C|nr:HNH endonuclease [Oryzibacter oryziterrae]